MFGVKFFFNIFGDAFVAVVNDFHAEAESAPSDCLTDGSR
jgi:hypothetical protein